MKTYIKKEYFRHRADLSQYNQNVYECTYNGACILEKCDDDNTYYYFRFNKKTNKVGDYLGLSQFESIFDSDVEGVELDSDIW